MIQLFRACQHTYAHQVIRRDLELGNIFLGAYMNIKMGDFDLAALIENPGECKTIRGTPSYIAPRLLFDTTNGHDFEVNIGPSALSLCPRIRNYHQLLMTPSITRSLLKA